MGLTPFIRSALLACALLLTVAGAAWAGLGPNQANDKRFARERIEGYDYDRGTRCTQRRQPGVEKLVAWLGRRVDGANWGTYRCEKWGKGSFSVHAEGRAIDWHLDARKPAERRQAMKLIRKRLLATDRHGNHAALARRMGIQGLIYDCRTWFSGPGKLGDYGYCMNNRGKRKPMRKLNPTQAHVDHIHIEMNKAGARGKTSFWRSGLR